MTGEAVGGSGDGNGRGGDCRDIKCREQDEKCWERQHQYGGCCDGQGRGGQGRGGNVSSGNAGNANGGSVTNSGGSIKNGKGASAAGIGGTSTSGNAFGGDAKRSPQDDPSDGSSLRQPDQCAYE